MLYIEILLTLIIVFFAVLFFIKELGKKNTGKCSCNCGNCSKHCSYSKNIR